jgi:UDP-N-acetylmuramoyl-tripeptide--D-alanyl-D-alanine ligase
LQHQTTVFLPGVFGTSVAYAIAAAFAVGLAMDISTEEMTRSATSYVGLPGRARIIQGVKYTTLLDDSYNAAPTSVLTAIRDMAAIPLQEHQRRIVCVGEMRELGEQAESLHRRVAEEVVRLGIDLFVPCGIFADAMAETAEKAGMDADRIHPFSDAPEAALFIQDWIRPGDLVLAKGSEGPLPGSEKWKTVTGVRMERVIKELMADPAHAEDLLCRQTPAWLS